MRALASNEVHTKLVEFGVEPVGSSGQVYAEVLKRDKLIWSSVVSGLDLSES